MQPAEIPLRAIVFDGHCHLCSGWVRFLEGRRLATPFALIAMQSSAGRDLLARHGIDPEDPATFLVLDNGLCLTRSAAVLHVVAALGGPWRLAQFGRLVPAPIRDALYDVLARNRYRWFGRRALCYVPRG